MKITKAPAPREIIDYFKEEFDLEFEVTEKYEYDDCDLVSYTKWFTISLPDRVGLPMSEKDFKLLFKIKEKTTNVRVGFLQLASRLSYKDIVVNGEAHQVPFLTHTKNVEV